MPPRYGFPKSERLKSRKQIDGLFAGGKSYNAFPVRMAYRLFASPEGTQPALLVGVSAPKRHFKKAVHRNRIKRLLREAYRLQKPQLLALLEGANISGHVFFLYTDKLLPDYATIETSVGKCLQQLQRKAHEITA
ncbi:ribonuclease P protein component [Paracnuella aquatica]|uniref:ribonuclease P protein component n=1 Tax=Paracnuella aquatica TaxID=2268757 RepID=UPI000DEECDDB|nr:ribonuclease P protein component [Paracnuella aquatica]RPD48158.1 ribonuclease P protein component [Paracnuella aquatica]